SYHGSRHAQTNTSTDDTTNWFFHRRPREWSTPNLGRGEDFARSFLYFPKWGAVFCGNGSKPLSSFSITYRLASLF
ncbi:MAG: hypothetical protein ACRDHZ_23970, partial [Ktedonobacteraceae bacterium]